MSKLRQGAKVYAVLLGRKIMIVDTQTLMKMESVGLVGQLVLFMEGDGRGGLTARIARMFMSEVKS